MGNNVVLDYERAAMRGDPMPSGMEFPDQVMYQALSLLYARYRIGSVSRDQASSEKRRMLAEYENFLFRWHMGSRWANILKATEVAHTNYTKERTLENADALSAVLNGFLAEENI